MNSTLKAACKASLLALVVALAGCGSTSNLVNSNRTVGCNRSHELKTASTTVEFGLGQRWKTCSGYLLAFQPDGNLVVYNPSGAALWNSATGNRGATRLSLQPDGNLVIYAGTFAVWSSSTPGNPGATLIIQADGNVVLYSVYGSVLWQTATTGR